jgi:predicted ATPase/DNA-binding SARP family transcriptional activator
MQYRVLGPLEVLDASGQKLALGGAMQQSVLASLLLRVEQTVTVEQLVEQLWDEPPKTALRTVQVYISRLRQALPTGVIESRSGGYALMLKRDRLDLGSFEETAREGRAALAGHDCERASHLLWEALAVWRGPALAGLTSEALRREAARLEELRLQVLEDRFDAELACRRHRTVVPELQALVAEEPFRERPRMQLMLALHRSGRPGDALELYRQTRRLLVEELGMEPGEELRRLEQAILRADPALEPPALAPSNLPAQPTPLVGRQRELAEVLGLLRAKRLVTLTGPGGVGKTRLAQEAASHALDEFRDGVWFVSLGALQEPGLMLQTVARTLGVAEPQALASYLSERQLLLVLDNFEQLLEAAPQVAQLLRQAPRLKLLVTSRGSLHLAGEQEYPVPPLNEEEGERLFTERAREAKPTFQRDEQVAFICRRLDDLPLALELAAARVKVMTTTTLVERLNERLPLLVGGPRDRPQRQRTLRATLQWSYELLTEEEQNLFVRLAVFVGGCTFEAAHAVAAAEIDMLESLVDKSLVHERRDRFFMLETVREFGLELLGEATDARDLRGRHASFFAELFGSAEARPGTISFVGTQLRDRLAPEVDNVRTAVEWALAADEIELALELIYMSAPLPFSVAEISVWYDRVLGRASSIGDRNAAGVYYDASFSKLLLGEVADAHLLGQRSLALYRNVNDFAGEGDALRMLGTILSRLGRKEEARQCFDLALARAEEHDLEELRCSVLHELGEFEHDIGNLERSARLLAQSIEVARAQSNPLRTSLALSGFADLLFDQGNLDGAEQRYAEALALDRELSFDHGSMHDLAGLAATAAARGDAERAGRLWGAAMALERELQTFGDRERARYERALVAVAGPKFDAALATADGADLESLVEDELAQGASDDRVTPRPTSSPAQPAC